MRRMKNERNEKDISILFSFFKLSDKNMPWKISRLRYCFPIDDKMKYNYKHFYLFLKFFFSIKRNI